MTPSQKKPATRKKAKRSKKTASKSDTSGKTAQSVVFPSATPKIVYLSFSAEVNVTTVEQLLAFCAGQVNLGVTEIHIGMSTKGGGVREGVNAFHVLCGLPAKIIMYNTSAVDSIGNAIFLAGDERYACKGTTFLFHGVGLVLAANAPWRTDEPSLRERLDLIASDNKKIAGIICSRTRIRPKEAAGLFREEATKDTVYAEENGIIQAVKPFKIPAGVPVYQLAFDR